MLQLMAETGDRHVLARKAVHPRSCMLIVPDMWQVLCSHSASGTEFHRHGVAWARAVPSAIEGEAS